MFVGLKPGSESKTFNLLPMQSSSWPSLLLCLSLDAIQFFFNYSPFESEAMSARTSARTLQDPYVLCADDAAIVSLSMQKI